MKDASSGASTDDWDDAIRATPGVDGGQMFVPMMLGRAGGKPRRIR